MLEYLVASLYKHLIGRSIWFSLPTSEHLGSLRQVVTTVKHADVGMRAFCVLTIADTGQSIVDDDKVLHLLFKEALVAAPLIVAQDGMRVKSTGLRDSHIRNYILKPPRPPSTQTAVTRLPSTAKSPHVAFMGSEVSLLLHPSVTLDILETAVHSVLELVSMVAPALEVELRVIGRCANGEVHNTGGGAGGSWELAPCGGHSRSTTQMAAEEMTPAQQQTGAHTATTTSRMRYDHEPLPPELDAHERLLHGVTTCYSAANTNTSQVCNSDNHQNDPTAPTDFHSNPSLDFHDHMIIDGGTSSHMWSCDDDQLGGMQHHVPFAVQLSPHGLLYNTQCGQSQEIQLQENYIQQQCQQGPDMQLQEELMYYDDHMGGPDDMPTAGHLVAHQLPGGPMDGISGPRVGPGPGHGSGHAIVVASGCSGMASSDHRQPANLRRCKWSAHTVIVLDSTRLEGSSHDAGSGPEAGVPQGAPEGAAADVVPVVLFQDYAPLARCCKGLAKAFLRCGWSQYGIDIASHQVSEDTNMLSITLYPSSCQLAHAISSIFIHLVSSPPPEAEPHRRPPLGPVTEAKLLQCSVESALSSLKEQYPGRLLNKSEQRLCVALPQLAGCVAGIVAQSDNGSFLAAACEVMGCDHVGELQGGVLQALQGALSK